MINKWLGIGNLTRDVDLKYSHQGDTIANFTIACGEKYKDKSGNMQEQTEFVRIVAFKRLAEICGKYLNKGSKVYIEGKMQTRKYQDKDGVQRYTTEIIAQNMQMLGGQRNDSPKDTGYDVPDDGDAPF